MKQRRCRIAAAEEGFSACTEPNCGDEVHRYGMIVVLARGFRYRGVAQIKRLACSLLLLSSMPVIGIAAEPASHRPAERPMAGVYSEKTDQQLTELTAQWDTLDDSERQALLTEVKMRMARSKGRGGVIRIRTQRRYGRIVRKADGSVVRIETKVVRVRPVGPGTQPYGVGFERRAASKQPERDSPPVLTVKDPAP